MREAQLGSKKAELEAQKRQRAVLDSQELLLRIRRKRDGIRLQQEIFRNWIIVNVLAGLLLAGRPLGR